MAQQRRRFARGAALVAGVALVLGVALPALGSGAVDLTTIDSTATVNGAVFQQGPLDTSAGTGVLDPFLQVKNSGNDPAIEQGFNTDAAPQFDEQDNWTEALLLSTVPTREVGGTLYRVLYLDINQVNSTSLISLDELKLFLVSSALVTDYDPATEKFDGVAYPKIYDLGDSWLKLDYSLQAGSGQSDMTALIPEAFFAGAGPSCQYGQPGCATWLTVWNKFGVNYPNNDGFEEWSTEVLPFVQMTKTATGTFDRKYDWTIDKSGNPLTHNLFAGGSASTDYDITVDQTVTDSNIKVTGTVTITVPAKLPDGDKDAPDAVVTALSDVFDQAGTETTGTFTDCAAPFTVKAGTSRVCTYSLTPPTADPGVNTATATVEDSPQTFMATASVGAFSATVTGYPEVNVTDQFGAEAADALGSADGDYTFDDDRTFSCSADPSMYTNGTYSYQLKNTATIVETGQTDDVTVTVNCYAPVVTKDASTYWNRAWDWTITKDWDATYDLFAGDSVEHDYKVSVDPTYTDDEWGVKGSIHVQNPHPTEKMTLASVSDLAGGISAPVTCPTLEIAAGGTLTCTYDTGAQNSPNSNPFGATNTATAAFGGATWTGTAAIVFSDVPTSEDDPVITVDDDNLTGEDWEASGAYAEWTYSKDFACSSDPDDYTGGKYSYSHTNTATIVGTTDKDTATVDVNCYAPVVSKTAAGSYDKTYTWDIDKTKDGEYWKFLGDPATTHDYNVAVDQTMTPSNWVVSGVITVANPNPNAAMTVDLSDSLSSGETASLIDCTNPVTVPMGGSVDCKYTAATSGPADGTNTATATLNKIDFSGSKGYTFTANVIGFPEINVADTNLKSWTASGDDSWDYTSDFSCPTDTSLYEGGVYSFMHVNTATIAETSQSDDATVKVHCYLPVVSKSADATFDRDWAWTINKTGDQTALELAVGQSFLVNYEVTVSAKYTDAGYEVTGEVSVTNPNPKAAMGVKVADAVDGTTAKIDCGGGWGDDTLTVPAGDKASCKYAIDFGATKPTSTTNVATVSFNGATYTAEKGFSWSIDKETDECVDLTDSKYGNLGTFCADPGNTSKTFKYSKFVGPYEVCGTYQYKNTATFTTNNTGTTDSSSWTVDINIPCGGCTLTQGYWKTHSAYGPAPFDEAWDLLDTWYSSDGGATWIDGDGANEGADELFFSPLTAFSWHDAFWTAPGGNAYYQLAHQYQAAVLNILNEASAPSSVTDAIAHAEMLFEKYTPAQIGALKGNDKVRKDFISTAGILDSYNTGETGPGHCDEDGLSSTD